MTNRDVADKAIGQLLTGLRALIREEIVCASPEADPLIPHYKAPFERRKTLRLIRSGKLPATKIGKVYYIRQSAIDALAEAEPVDTAPADRAEALDEIDEILLGATRGRK